MKRFVLATTNSHKVREVRTALAELSDWEVLPQPDAVPPIEETGSTFVANAILKSVHTSHFVDDLVVADDSGLCVDALGGQPGVYSARYADSQESRIRRVLTELESIPEARRGARFVCALALSRRGEVIWTTEARVEGVILRTPLGLNGFGYDPIFWIPELGRTMAELTIQEKNRISHRGRALQHLASFLNSL